MNDDKLDNRRIFIWRGQNLVEETNRLAEAVAEETMTELFELNGVLMWRNNGQPVTKTVLREIITRLIKSIRWINSGTDDAPNWEYEFFAFEFRPQANTLYEPDEQVLINLMNVSLVARIARGPRKVPRLKEQQERDARARLKSGERPDAIAKAYGVDLETISRLARVG